MDARRLLAFVLLALGQSSCGKPDADEADTESTAASTTGVADASTVTTSATSTDETSSAHSDSGKAGGSTGEDDPTSGASSSGEPGSEGIVDTVQLSEPYGFDGLYMDPRGVLFGAGGWQDDAVVRIGDDGTISPFSTGHGGPIHLTLGGDGFYYVTNYTDNTLRRVPPDGGAPTTIATGLDGPSGAVTAADGTVYFVGWGVEGNTGRFLYRVTEDGDVVVHVDGEGLQVPQGLAADERGNLYVANAVDGRVHRVAPEGTVSLLGQLPSGANYNVAHMLYGNGRLYATGGENNVIYAIELDGAATFWGTGDAETIDGPLEQAAFDRPGGLALSPDGTTLWVSGGGGTSLRRIRFN
ncbi:MAG: hypothetical protein ACRBN8_39430 [Nannocystales bacterium]